MLLTLPFLLAVTGAAKLPAPVVFTQISTASDSFSKWEGSTIMLLKEDGSVTPLTQRLSRSADPEVSFDGTRILFSNKRKPDIAWQIMEMKPDGTDLRQITSGLRDVRSPIYQSKLFVLDAEKPWYQISYVGIEKGRRQVLSIRPDGSAERQLTYTPNGVSDPYLMADGRILYSSRKEIFGINLDGTDVALFAGEEGGRPKKMVTATTDGLVVFVEPKEGEPSGAGDLASVSLRRNLHSYRKLKEGLFLHPSPLPRGDLLVSYKPDGASTFGIYRLRPSTGVLTKVFSDPESHSLQPKLLAPRPEPDGRSSVVDENVPTGQLYLLDARISDRPTGAVERIRFSDEKSHILGELKLEKDGSFFAQVPVNLPLALEGLDKEGKVVRTCKWIWVKNRENRGCIGCHESGERTPDNVFAEALRKPAVKIGEGRKP